MGDTIQYDKGVLTDESDDRKFSKKDDTVHSLPCSEIGAFGDSLWTSIHAHVDSGQALRTSVNGKTTLQDIIDVDDVR